jgi:hypothetical protein
MNSKTIETVEDVELQKIKDENLEEYKSSLRIMIKHAANPEPYMKELRKLEGKNEKEN